MSLRLVATLALLLVVDRVAAQQAPPAVPPVSVQRPGAALKPEDRAAYLDARIAAVHAGLRLTAPQDALWPAFETAVRDGIAQSILLRERMVAAGRPADPIERLSRIAEGAIARGEVLRRIVDAARPLYASLTEEQKARIPILVGAGTGFGALGFSLLPHRLFPTQGGPGRQPPVSRQPDGRGPDRFGPPPGGDKD